MTFRRARRALAAVGLALAAAQAVLWAVPASHPAPVTAQAWDDRGDWARQTLRRRGLDRHGYVWQARVRSWDAPAAADLDRLRRTRAADALTPTDSWRLQLTTYGVNHVFFPSGVTFGETGVVCSLPYSVVIAALSTPALAWGATAGWRRMKARRRG